MIRIRECLAGPNSTFFNPSEPRPHAENYSLNIPYLNIRGRFALLWNGDCADVRRMMRVAF